MPGGINAPLDVILAWPTPNYQDPITRPKYVLIFSCILGPISIVLLLTRLWVRIRLQHNAEWDDWLMLAAAFPMLAMTIVFPMVTEVYRFDRHVWDIEPKYFPIQRKFVMAIYILFSLTTGLIKLSILLFYRRLSSRTVSPAFRWVIRLTIFSIGGYSIAFIIISIFTCRPISAFWNQVDASKRLKGYKYTCLNEGVDVVTHGVISTVQDLIVAFLPTLLCWNLHISRRQKIALYSIFGLGYVSVVVGAMRTYSGYRLFFMTYDVTWVAGDIWLWSLLELHIGCICANAPALKIFYKKVLKVDRLASWKRSRSLSRSNNSKKQNSRSGDGVAGRDAGFKRSWYKNLLRSGRHGHMRSPQFNISSPLSTTLQSDAQSSLKRPHTSDSMTKPLASEYIDTVIGYDGQAQDIELGGLPVSQTPLEDDMQAPTPCQTSMSMGQRGGRPPPLSQVRLSWRMYGQRYVWRPWERNARDSKDAEYPEWV